MIHLLTILFTINVSGVITLSSEVSTDEQDSKFIASIWNLQQHICTGSILDESHILTAGYCVKELSPFTLSVSIGDSTLVLDNIELLPVLAIHLDPEYGEPQCPSNANQCDSVNEIAIVELARNLIWGPHLAAIRLSDRESTFNPCIPCKLFGWNKHNIIDITSLELRQTEALLLCETKCESVTDLMRSDNILMNIRLFDEIDKVDYGSPIICDGAPVGILTDGGQEHNGPVVISIYGHLEFIRKTSGIYKSDINELLPPYAAIFGNGELLCGGSIIGHTHILTAAHCVDNIAVENLGIIVGRRKFYKERLTPLDFLSVERINMVMNYVREMDHMGLVNFLNDIAVLKLKTPLVLGDNIGKLGISEAVPYEKTCSLYRWSHTTTTDGETLFRSMKSTVFTHSPHTCQFFNDMLEPTAFCVWSMDSLPGAMDGNGGSPIVCDGLDVAGVLSTTTQSNELDDGPMQLMYYTSVFPNFEFLIDNIAD